MPLPHDLSALQVLRGMIAKACPTEISGSCARRAAARARTTARSDAVHVLVQVQGVDTSVASLEALAQLPALTSLAIDGLDGGRCLLLQRLTRLTHLSLTVRPACLCLCVR